MGSWERRSARLAAATFVAVAVLAVPPIAAAASSTPEDGAVLEPFFGSPAAALSHWTQARLEQAEALPIVTVPEVPQEAAPTPPETIQTASSEVPAEKASEIPRETASTAALDGAMTTAVGGIEVATMESVLFPNSANGKVFGVYRIPKGPFHVEKREYQCSGSVVDSTEGNVVLTAGHCVIDPETGTPASEVIFIPGYREGSGPLGKWAALSYATTETWMRTVGKPVPNEGGDLAFLVMDDSPEGGSNIQEGTGGLGIAFDQSCEQSYTQYGYPGEAPYDGEVLYSHTTAYAGSDTNPNLSPAPMRIASDFTKGASGGPWTIGPGTSPTVLSLTAYGYENQPGYLYGPYFGEAARKAYELASGISVPVSIEESCKPLEVPAVTPPEPSAAPAPPSEASPPPPSVTLEVTRVRRRGNGSAVLTAKVSTAGMLKLSGTAVRAETLDTLAAGKYRLVVATKGPTNRRLVRKGRAKVGVKIAFVASGKTKRLSRAIQLSRRSARRPAQQPASQSR